MLIFMYLSTTGKPAEKKERGINSSFLRFLKKCGIKRSTQKYI